MNNATKLIKIIFAGTILVILATATIYTATAAETDNVATNSQPVLTFANDPLLSKTTPAFTNVTSDEVSGTNEIEANVSSHRGMAEFNVEVSRPMLRSARQHLHATNQVQMSGVQPQLRAVSLSATKTAAEADVARERMISEQLVARGIANQAVLSAMRKTPRILPFEVAGDAFEDKPVDIRYGRTVESPYVVASVAEQFNPNPKSSDRVLEIGTGSGYQTAVLSLVVKEVYSVETNTILARRAEVDLQNIGYTNNIFLRAGNVTQGWPEAAPFDAVVVNGDLNQTSETIISQLKEGGRLIIPVGQDGNLHVLQKASGQLIALTSRPVRLPPTTSNKIALPTLKQIATPKAQ